ncbi:MAG TPA: hypothetical protein ENJ68_03750 [Devosia sp.]|nr:hypothetical protein [Devosia sp.]
MKPSGKLNIVTGLLVMAGFMLYGFVLIYLRDFAPGKEEWIAGAANGKHFEATLAHVHGNLFAFLNIMIGYLLLKLPVPDRSARWISITGVVGLLMPLGILSEFTLGLPPYLVFVGALSIIVSIGWLGLALFKADFSRV